MAIPIKYGPILIHGLSYNSSNKANGSCTLATYLNCIAKKKVTIQEDTNNTHIDIVTYLSCFLPLKIMKVK